MLGPLGPLQEHEEVPLRFGEHVYEGARSPIQSPSVQIPILQAGHKPRSYASQVHYPAAIEALRNLTLAHQDDQLVTGHNWRLQVHNALSVVDNAFTNVMQMPARRRRYPKNPDALSNYMSLTTANAANHASSKLLSMFIL
ncbi:hypothetical protein SSX86_001311 [Deinandra increscens subsp. villosa]|uniref:Uncharacterized protein n=1 Tax=Deinandra increscens subsp. villosa TaxID=3103831 RepID=A0AAP0DUR3_9ASTR